jgi:hypothetical protein
MTLSDWSRGRLLSDPEMQLAVDERGRVLYGADSVIPAPGPVVAAAFVRAGILCVSTESGEFAVWQLADRVEKVGDRHLGVPITSVAISDAAQTVAVACDDNNIRVLRVEDLSEIECLTVAGFTRDLDLGGDQLVAALSHDRRIRVWDLVSRTLVSESSAAGDARRLTIDDSGEYVIFGDSEPRGRIPLNERALTAWARQAAGRELTAEERRRYIDDPSAQPSTAAQEAQ